LSKGDQAADYKGADEKLLTLIVDESDKRIGAQVQIMLANDARSNGLLAAAATLAGAAYAVAAAQLGKDGNFALLVGATVFAVMATAAAMVAVWALWPVGVDVQGWSPRLFVSNIEDQTPYLTVQAEIAALNQSKLDDNDRCNKSLADRTRLTMTLVASAPVLGAVALVLSSVHICAAR
jgi:hypothetical protein